MSPCDFLSVGSINSNQDTTSLVIQGLGGAMAAGAKTLPGAERVGHSMLSAVASIHVFDRERTSCSLA